MTDALDLDQVTLNARHHRPDVAEGDAGEQEAPEQGQRDPQQRGQQAVAPVLGDREGGVAHLPHAVKAVGAHGFCNHVFEIHLRGWEGQSFSLSIHPLPTLLCASIRMLWKAVAPAGGVPPLGMLKQHSREGT